MPTASASKAKPKKEKAEKSTAEDTGKKEEKKAKPKVAKEKKEKTNEVKEKKEPKAKKEKEPLEGERKRKPHRPLAKHHETHPEAEGGKKTAAQKKTDNKFSKFNIDEVPPLPSPSFLTPLTHSLFPLTYRLVDVILLRPNEKE
jgi:hypothetical protein